MRAGIVGRAALLLLLLLVLGLALAPAESAEAGPGLARPDSDGKIALPRRRRRALTVYLVSTRAPIELEVLGQALARRGHSVVRSNGTVPRDASKYDVLVVDKRYLEAYEVQQTLSKVVLLDSDMLLDADMPPLSVPAPITAYGGAEETDYRESTWVRARNAIDRLKWHASALGRRRASKRHFLTLSTSSFLLETSRPLPPWLVMIGPVHDDDLPKPQRMKLVTPDGHLARIFMLGSRLPRSVFVRVLEMIRHSQRQNALVVIATRPSSMIDPTGELRKSLLPGSFWMEMLDTISPFPGVRTIISTADLRTVLAILKQGIVPLVVTDPDDPYTQALAIALKRKELGVGLFEEGALDDVQTLVSKYRDNARAAGKILTSPLERNGMRKAIRFIETIGDKDIDAIAELLDPWMPPWYQYWALDVYLVFAIVLASLIRLAGILASVATNDRLSR